MSEGLDDEVSHLSKCEQLDELCANVSTLAVTTMVRNPHIQDLAEWVAYHLVRGASRVLIYDHGRIDGHSRGLESLYQPLQGWLDDGLVEIHTRLSPQACARNRYADEGRLSTPDVFWTQAMLTDAQMRLCDEFSWVAFLDHDEFLNTQSSAPLLLVFDAHATPATAVLQVQMRRLVTQGTICARADSCLRTTHGESATFP